jgi:hypothetical protein
MSDLPPQVKEDAYRQTVHQGAVGEQLGQAGHRRTNHRDRKRFAHLMTTVMAMSIPLGPNAKALVHPSSIPRSRPPIVTITD